MADMIGPPSWEDAGTTTDFPAVYSYRLAIVAAELTRQTSYASALATFKAAGFSAAAFAAYKSAILAADTAYLQGVDLAGALAMVGSPPSPALSAVTSGALAAATYFVKTTFVTAQGETLPSVENSLAVLINQVVLVTSPAAPVQPGQNIVGYNVYVSTTTGTETKQNSSPIALGTNWQEPNTGLVAGAAPPGTNTSGIVGPPGNSLTALLPQNTALSIGLMY